MVCRGNEGRVYYDDLMNYILNACALDGARLRLSSTKEQIQRGTDGTPALFSAAGRLAAQMFLFLILCGFLLRARQK